MDECHAALMPPHQSGAAQSASTECLIGDPMHLMEKPIDCFNIVSGERIFDDRPNLLKSFSWSHGSPRHQAASASRGTMEAARWEVFWHLHLTLLSGRRDWSTRPHCGRHAGGEGATNTSIHSVQPVRKPLDQYGLNSMDALDRGYDPQRRCSWLASWINSLR